MATILWNISAQKNQVFFQTLSTSIRNSYLYSSPAKQWLMRYTQDNRKTSPLFAFWLSEKPRFLYFPFVFAVLFLKLNLMMPEFGKLTNFSVGILNSQNFPLCWFQYQKHFLAEMLEKITKQTLLETRKFNTMSQITSHFNTWTAWKFMKLINN